MSNKNKTGGTKREIGCEMRSSPPLLCWDIFMNSYRRKIVLLEDAKSIYDLSKKFKWKHNWDFRQKIVSENKIVIITTSTFEIVTASSNITEMNGYEVNEIIGKYPSMFQGIETRETSRQLIREAIKELRPFETNIINYHKRGNPYNCHIQGYPVFNIYNQLSHFIAFEDIA
jgi:PAS domain S-box-containing protein